MSLRLAYRAPPGQSTAGALGQAAHHPAGIATGRVCNTWGRPDAQSAHWIELAETD